MTRLHRAESQNIFICADPCFEGHVTMSGVVRDNLYVMMGQGTLTEPRCLGGGDVGPCQ